MIKKMGALLVKAGEFVGGVQSHSSHFTHPSYSSSGFMSADRALQVTGVWSCLRLISETGATLPLHLHKRSENGGRVRAKQHPLYERLHTAPNTDMTGVSFREALFVSMAIWGMAYVRAVRIGRHWALYPLPKPAVRVDRKNDQPPVFELRWHGKPERLPSLFVEPEAEVGIIPIVGFSGTGIEGFAPYQLHRNAIELASIAEEFGRSFFDNSAMPGGVIEIQGRYDPKKAKQFRESWNAVHQGPRKAGRIGMLFDGWVFKPTQITNNDAQLLEARKFQIAEIARIWRVPLNMLMEDKVTYNNTEQNNLQFLQYTLTPYLVRIEQALNRGLLTPQERQEYNIEFDVAGLLRGDSKSRGEFYKTMRLVGGITINELRAKENMPAIKGGDDVHVPLNMAPSDLLREIQEKD